MTDAIQNNIERKAGTGGYSISFNGISKSYGGRTVVEDVSVTVGAGEFVTILGPSGSGKTTLLMLIAGFINPDRGSLLLGDRDISMTPPSKRDLGVVFQSYALFPHMDVYGNVSYPLRARQIDRAEEQRRVAWALDKVQMGAFAGRRVSELSGGQQQRVALARAICFDPAALLMDEPLAALDKNLRGDMQEQIRSLQKSLGQTVIFVTHDQEEALAMSDRILVMGEGRVQQIDTPQELYLHPRNTFVAKFFGEANLLTGTPGPDGFRIGDHRVPMPQSGLQTGSRICVRPEALRLDPVGEGPDWSLKARVEDVRALGGIQRITLKTVAGVLTATRMVDGVTPLPQAGQDVDLSWAPALGHLLEDQAEFQKSRGGK